MKEWKTLYCDVDNLEDNLNWLERKGFSIYEIYSASEAGNTEADGSNFLVVASCTAAAKPPVPVKKENRNAVLTKSGSSGKIKVGKAKTSKIEVLEILKAKTCK